MRGLGQILGSRPGCSRRCLMLLLPGVVFGRVGLSPTIAVRWLVWRPAFVVVPDRLSRPLFYVPFCFGLLDAHASTFLVRSGSGKVVCLAIHGNPSLLIHCPLFGRWWRFYWCCSRLCWRRLDVSPVHGLLEGQRLCSWCGSAALNDVRLAVQ